MLDFSNNQMSPTGSLLDPDKETTGNSISLPSQVPDDLESEAPEIPTAIQAVAPQEVPIGQEETTGTQGVTPEVPTEPEVDSDVVTPDDVLTMEDELVTAFSFEAETKETEDEWSGFTIAPALVDDSSLPNLEDVGITQIDDREPVDDWGSSAMTIEPFVAPSLEERQLKEHTDGIVDTLNKIAYRGVKGLADAADFVTVPGWAIASTLGIGVDKPFSRALETFYPEKNYIIADEADSYYDDILRITATGLEFTTGGILTGGASSVGQKVVGVSDDVARFVMKDEVVAGLLSGVGYQSTLEYTDDEVAAFAVAILAPLASKPMGLLYEGSKKTAALAVTPVTWTVGKVYNISPVMQMVNPKVHLASLKVRLADNEKMWSKGYGKLARKLVEKLPENAEVDYEQQVAQLDNLAGWLRKSIPMTDRTKQHVSRMSDMEIKMNEFAQANGLGEFKLTLDQMYRPLLKDTKDIGGLEELLEVGKLIGAEAYIEQSRKNQDILYRYLQDTSTPVSVKQAAEFQEIFRAKADELEEVAENIYNVAIAEDMFNKASGAYDYPSHGMPQVLDRLNEVRKLHSEAYGAWRETLPEMDLDVSPIANAFEEMAATTGLFDDPKNTPAYLRKMVADLNSLGTSKTTRVTQLNTSDDLDIQLKELAKSRREVQLKQAKELEEAENKVALKAKHMEELKVLDDQRTTLSTQKLELAKEKRIETHRGDDGSINIPAPSFTSLDDVLKAHKILSDLKFDSLRLGDDRYTTIKPILDGVNETLESLKEVDENVYNTWSRLQDTYRKFVGVEMKDSYIKKAIGPDGRHYKLSSGRAVDTFFTNAKADEVEELLRVFDSKKEGLNGWLKVLPEETEEGAKGLLEVIKASGAQRFDQASEAAVGAYKDVVYTALAREVTNAVESTTNLDPSKRLEKIDSLVVSWMQKHREKLDVIPDLELTPENINKVRATLGRYTDMVKEVEEQRKLAMFSQLQGPGLTIQAAMKDDNKANQLASFLEDKLPELSYGDKGKLGGAAADNLRSLMYKSLIRDYMDGDILDYSSLSKKLTEGTTSRNNLIKVLGNHAVEKLDAKVALHKAVAASGIPLAEALNADKVINGLGKVGISLGRIGSLLQRRAVFQPSGGYLAGAAATKLINLSGKRETSKAIQIFMDNPSSLVEFDNILLAAKKKLSASHQLRMDAVLQDPARNIKELYPLLKELYVGEAKGYFAYLGLQIPDEDIETAIKEVFYNENTMPVTEEEPEETLPALLTEDDITLLKERGKFTEDDEAFIRGEGRVEPKDNIKDELDKMSPEERLELLKLYQGGKDDIKILLDGMSPEERMELMKQYETTGNDS